jgi:hypothetical protein
MAYCSRVGKAYNQINGGSANGDAFVDWRTKCTSVLNHDIYVPSRRSRAVPRNPATLRGIVLLNSSYKCLDTKLNINFFKNKSTYRHFFLKYSEYTSKLVL